MKSKKVKMIRIMPKVKIDVETHARLKVVSAMQRREMQETATIAINEYCEKNGI